MVRNSHATIDDLHGALGRQVIFSLCVLLLEIPLGVGLALAMPASGWRASAVLVIRRDARC